MPNDNQNTGPTTQTAIPNVSPQMDIPPLPSSFPIQSVTPPATFTTQSPKKKLGGGRIVATILGILVLVGGVGAGFVLTQRPQLLRSLARPEEGTGFGGGTTTTGGNNSGGNNNGGNNGGNNSGGNTGGSSSGGTTSQPAPGHFGYVYSPTGDNGQAYVAGTYIAPNGQRYLVQSPGTLQAAQQYLASHPGAATTLNFAPSVLTAIRTGVGVQPPGGPVACGSSGYSNFDAQTVSEPCQGGGYNIEKVARSGCPGGASQCWCTTDSTNCAGQPSGTRTTTTTTTTMTASCQSVTTYDASWAPMTVAQLSTVASGTTVNFCVNGTASDGSTFDKAKFTINGAVQPETTTQRPGSTDFCQSYQIPPGVSGFKVSAQIHHATLGWSL